MKVYQKVRRFIEGSWNRKWWRKESEHRKICWSRKWRGMPSSGYLWWKYSGKEFKKELLENYPEASAAERGTPARLRQIVKNAEKNEIELGDIVKLYEYWRAFLAKANKLKKPPAVMSNRELVELFMGGLTMTIGQVVLQYLGTSLKNKDPEKREKGKTTDEIRRPEDRFDLEEVCRAAGKVSENAQGMLS